MSANRMVLLALAAVAALLLLSACGGAATATATADSFGSNTPVAGAPTGTTAPVATIDFEKSCSAVSGVFPTPDPTQAAVLSLFAPVSSDDWLLGEQTAAVTFLEYGDFQ